jgi:putative membrane protein
MLWVKAFHIIAIVCWFAALFYLPRLFVYHSMSEDQVSRERFKTMERKLYRGIGTPSMIATVILGIWLTSYNWSYYQSTGWYWLKLALVTLLIGYHYLSGYYLRQLRDERCQHGHVFFRWFNEIPVLVLIAVVVLAVVKPF